MQLLVWKLQLRQSLITDSGHAVIASSLTLSIPVSGFCEAADVDVSPRDSVEGLLSISAFGLHERPDDVACAMKTGREGSYGDVLL